MPRSGEMNLNLRQQIERDPLYQAAMREIAEDVKLEAERASPIGETGDYIDSFVIVPAGPSARPKVGNTDFASHWVEWGSIHNGPWAPLRRGVRAAGLRLDET